MVKRKAAKNYKYVQIYTGYRYATYSFMSAIRGHSSDKGITDVVESLREDVVKMLQANKAWNGVIQEYGEFFRTYLVQESVGVVGCGEESIVLIISEDNEWYNRLELTNELKHLNDDDYDEFASFMHALEF